MYIHVLPSLCKMLVIYWSCGDNDPKLYYAHVRKSRYKKILREVRGLRKLDQPNSHPNIVRYYGSWVDVAPTDDRKKIAPWKDMEGGKAM